MSAVGRHGAGYGLRRVCAAWGPSRTLYVMTSGQHRRAASRQSAGTEARDLTRRLVAIEADLEASRARATARSGLGFGSCRDIMGCPQAGADARYLHATSCRRGQMTVDHHSCPELRGTRSSVLRWTTAGSSPPRAQRRTARPPQSADLHGACRLSSAYQGSGAGPCGWITAPSMTDGMAQPDRSTAIQPFYAIIDARPTGRPSGSRHA